MQSLVKKIEGFLETKNITWINRNSYDFYRPANDKDFEGQKFVKVILKNEKGKNYRKQLVVSEKLFLVFDEKITRLEKDLSGEWAKYQEQVAREEAEASFDEDTKEKITNFNKYLNEDQYAWD